MSMKAVLFVFGGLTVVAIVSGTILSVLRFQEHAAAQKAFTKASALVDIAVANLADAQDLYDYEESVASSAYVDYIFCFYWCSDELAYYLSATSSASEASVLLDAASSSLASARASEKQAEILTEKTATAFNQTALWIGVGVGGLLVTTLVLLATARRRASRASANSVSVSDSAWKCLDCAKENVGGLFCIECGSRSRTISDSVDSPRS